MCGMWTSPVENEGPAGPWGTLDIGTSQQPHSPVFLGTQPWEARERLQTKVRELTIPLFYLFSRHKHLGPGIKLDRACGSTTFCGLDSETERLREDGENKNFPWYVGAAGEKWWGMGTCVLVLAPPRPSYVTLGKSLGPSFLSYFSSTSWSYGGVIQCSQGGLWNM